MAKKKIRPGRALRVANKGKKGRGLPGGDVRWGKAPAIESSRTTTHAGVTIRIMKQD